MALGLWSDDRRGALQKGILHVLNAQYSRDLTDRIRDGYAAKFARLGLPGGALPWGLSLDGCDRYWYRAHR